MQIGRSSQGPQPRDPQDSPLDPDLTRANREGIEKTSRKHAAKNREAREAARRDSFERSRPDRDLGVDVGDRIKNARDKAQRADKVEAKAGDNSRAEAHRIEGARIKDARSEATRIENARADKVDVKVDRAEVQRIEAARIKAARSEATRIENARADKVEVKVDRAEAQRIESARDQHRISEARSGGLSRESVQLSGESQRLATDGELPGPGGSRESEAERADRLEALRIANARGELNTPERIRNAAGRLLGGQ